MRLLLVLLLYTATLAQKRGWRKGEWISGLEAPEEAKAGWPEKPPMRGAAPLADRSPVKTPPDGPTGRERAAASLLEPLWTTPTHSFGPKQNVVTGLALRYNLASHRAFVGTLRRTGYLGDVVIITEPLTDLPGNAARYLRQMGVVAYPIQPDCTQSKASSIKHKTCKWRDGQPDLPLAIIRHALYHAIAVLYPPDAQFYVADYRDTFFQLDPFQTLELSRGGRLQGLELVLVAEHWPFKKLGNCPFNGGWVRSCWGKEEFAEMRESNVLCSGSYMGAQPAIVNFEQTLLAEADDQMCHERGVPSDQGYLNYLYYSGKLPSATVVESRGEGVVNTVGSLDGSRPRNAGYLPKTHVNIGEYWHMRDDQGFVLQDDGITRSAAVHQYDRFHIEFEKFVVKLGAECDAPGQTPCYEGG